MKDHHINVFWSDEDEGYIADIPDLEGCSAFGEAPEQALAEVEQAKQAWLQAARGKPAGPCPSLVTGLRSTPADTRTPGRAWSGDRVVVYGSQP